MAKPIQYCKVKKKKKNKDKKYDAYNLKYSKMFHQVNGDFQIFLSHGWK